MVLLFANLLLHPLGATRGCLAVFACSALAKSCTGFSLANPISCQSLYGRRELNFSVLFTKVQSFCNHNIIYI